MNFPIEGDPKIEIFPNPVGSVNPVIQLSNFSNSSLHLQLFNSTGQLLIEKELQLINGAEQTTLPVISFPKGVYFLKCKYGNHFMIRKLLR